MNLSKKTIKHILRILDNKCVEDKSRAHVLSAGGYKLVTREFTPKNRQTYGWWSVVYTPREGYFFGTKNEKSDVFGMDLNSPDIKSPVQLADL